MAKVVPPFDKDSYGTPVMILDRVRSVFGGEIYYDPFSNELAQTRVCARHYGTKENPLPCETWYLEKLFVNPPYSNTALAIPLFERCVSGIVLTNADTSTEWFHTLNDLSDRLCFLRRRLSFLHPVTGDPVVGNRCGQVLFFKGNYDEKALFTFYFQSLGCINEKVA